MTYGCVRSIGTFVGVAAAFVLSGTAFAQPLTSQGKTWTESPTPPGIIALQSQKATIDRWRILQDTQTKIFEIQQDVTVNKAKVADKAYQEMQRYINDGSAPVQIKQPKLTTSGKVTTSPAPGVPLPSGTPAAELYFRMFLFSGSGSPRTATPASPLWSTELSYSYSGYGEWTLFGESAPSAFIAMIDPGTTLDVVFEMEFRYDTSAAGDDVRFLFATGGNPMTELPEMTFDLQMLVVPGPPAAWMAAATMLLAARRRRAVTT